MFLPACWGLSVLILSLSKYVEASSLFLFRTETTNNKDMVTISRTSNRIKRVFCIITTSIISIINKLLINYNNEWWE